MSLLWVVPLSVTAAGLVAVAVAASRAAEEAARLRAELGHLAGLRPAVADVRAGAQALRESLEWFRRT
ncbi:MAG: hypothetical protein M3N68_07155 [Actinomycetota bacterium]|nr:hypothetical protein [Actinomycetota bacterium]